MAKLTHKQQLEIWDQEHQNPYILKQMDSKDPSGGVILFWEWLQKKGIHLPRKGLEICCGKGRSCIGLAEQGIEMTGFDFSPTAIHEAQKRAKQAGVEQKTHFLVQDATTQWPFAADNFDFVVDCFGTTDIESLEGREFVALEIRRILRAQGYFLTYTLSPEDEFHKEMLQQAPAEEKNAFYHPTTGKFEKTFDRDELLELYKGLKLVEERRIQKTTEFFGKEYNCYHWWMVFQKP